MKLYSTIATATFTALFLLAVANFAQAQLTGSVDIDISGLPTGGDDPLNDVVLNIDLGTGGRDALITGVGYDLSLEANDPSWLSHAAIAFNPGPFYPFQIVPGLFFGDTFPGVASYSSGGIQDLTMIPIPGSTDTADISFTAPDGILTVTLYEFVDDASVAPDGFWSDSSTISVTYSYVPEPASIVLFGMASLGLCCLRCCRQNVEP